MVQLHSVSCPTTPYVYLLVTEPINIDSVFFLLQGAKEEAKTEETEKEKLCELKQHKKIIDKGKPDDVMPGRKA